MDYCSRYAWSKKHYKLLSYRPTSDQPLAALAMLCQQWHWDSISRLCKALAPCPVVRPTIDLSWEMEAPCSSLPQGSNWTIPKIWTGPHCLKSTSGTGREEESGELKVSVMPMCLKRRLTVVDTSHNGRWKVRLFVIDSQWWESPGLYSAVYGDVCMCAYMMVDVKHGENPHGGVFPSQTHL